MSRELVKAGDVEPIEQQWRYNDAFATGAEARAYIEEPVGTRLYWNGAAFAAPDSTLAGFTFDALAGTLRGSFTYPTLAIGKEVFLELKPTGPAAILAAVVTESRRVVEYLTDEVHAHVSTRESEASAAARAATSQAEHDATQASVGAIPVSQTRKVRRTAQ